MVTIAQQGLHGSSLLFTAMLSRLNQFSVAGLCFADYGYCLQHGFIM